MRKLISTAILAGALCAGAVQAQTSDGNRTTVPWSDPSRPGLVQVSVISGSISVRAHSGKDVIVEGTAVNRRGRNRVPDKNAEGLTLIGGTGSGMTIEEANNILTVSSGNWMGGGGSNMEIQVPAKTNLKLSTINGNSITVEGVDGDIEVTNINGDLRFTNVSGSVVAHAQNGNIFATVREVTGSKAMSFTAFNGNVDVTLPPAAKANLKLRSDHGDVWSGFELKESPNVPTVAAGGRGGGSKISMDRATIGTINGGGSSIELVTFHGDLYLRKAK